MNSIKSPLQLTLLIVLIFFLFLGCEKPNSGSAPSGKNGSGDQAKSYQKKEANNGESAKRGKPGKKRGSKKKISAKIMADGSIKHAKTEGSIHKVAATILGTPVT